MYVSDKILACPSLARVSRIVRWSMDILLFRESRGNIAVPGVMLHRPVPTRCSVKPHAWRANGAASRFALGSCVDVRPSGRGGAHRKIWPCGLVIHAH